MICKSSSYFRRRCTSGSRDIIDLDEDDPVVFDLFLKWLRNPDPPITYNPDGQSQEPWLSNSAAAWILGKKLRTTEGFKKYALSQFIQNCALAAFGPWDTIEREAPPGSPLRRFSDHWVAWNCRLSGSGANEFTGLHAALRAPLVPENTRDPRIYDIEHWYSSCGDGMHPGCIHDPITRQENIDEANRPPPEPLVEWGRSFELQRTGLPPASDHVSPNINISHALNTPAAPASPSYPTRPTASRISVDDKLWFSLADK
ncbi:hypothetical protein GP486_003321 [Trichoglossum hirsutum]|uniref:BTB domain-containing protein n=1 Tax=Trichoglossum hirsutum TaxID=265104 RepID=A0A9P8LDA1_9PEZI|nr:hypothetical protein GP486_003321 [Trichoglossum hirsutum]